MNTAQKRYTTRVKRLVTSMNLQEPDCVGIMPVLGTWAAHYLNRDSLELAFDHKALQETFLQLAKDFDFDAINAPSGCRCGPVYSTLGSTEFSFYSQDGVSHPGVQHIGRTNMEPSEYPELIADAYKFINETLLPRKFPALSVPEPRRSMNLAKGALQWMDYMNNCMAPLLRRLREDEGLPVFTSAATEMPLDVLADFFRGFQGVTMDIRRHKEPLLAACEALLPLMLAAAIGGKQAEDFPTSFIPLHIPTYLRPSDFETFYFPTFKAMIEGIVAAGRRPTLFMEGNWLPYADYFQELPKGKVNGIFEYGDHKEMKARFGNILCLVGGVSLHMLNYATRDEIIAHTRRLIDDMAPGGGWILGFDKTMLSANDAKAENLHAVIETVRKYGVY